MKKTRQQRAKRSRDMVDVYLNIVLNTVKADAPNSRKIQRTPTTKQLGILTLVHMMHVQPVSSSLSNHNFQCPQTIG